MVDGAEAGFALFFHNYSTFLGRPGIYLEDLYVRPELRGRGIGGALLRHLARLALERGCGRLEWSVLDWNEPALALLPLDRREAGRGLDRASPRGRFAHQARSAMRRIALTIETLRYTRHPRR